MASSSIQLIVGLANPGKEYAETRHNVGAWFVDRIIRETKITLRFEAKYHGLHGIAHFNHARPNATCHLLIPTTFMNHSGQAVSACMRYNKINAESLLIVHDEIDLPVGVSKLKFDGGDSGHNGLKDVIHHLGTKKFYRLRIGVGRPLHSKDVVDYVLNRPSKTDRNKIESALELAENVLPLILKGDIERAMQTLHTKE